MTPEQLIKQWRERARTLRLIDYTTRAMAAEITQCADELEAARIHVKLCDYIHDEVINGCYTAEECRDEIADYSLRLTQQLERKNDTN